jgi:hypothetical protein
MGQTTFSGPVVSPGGFIGPAFGGLIPFTGTYYYVNPATGADGNTGLSPVQALKTLTAALDKCSSGKNDVVFLIGNGQASGTARLTAKLSWNKDATHLIGICSPVNISQRARISHAATAPATAFTPMVEVTGDGCMFANIQIFEGFAESTAVVAWEDEGERNYYSNVHFAGMGNATYSADETGSACLLLTGGGEHLFENCTFGLDTVPRTVANANIRLRSQTARNTFNNCLFPIYATAAGVLAVDANAASSLNRWALFQNCVMINAQNIGGETTMTVAAVGNAAQNGVLLFNNCVRNNITDYGAAGDLIKIANSVNALTDQDGGDFQDAA